LVRRAILPRLEGGGIALDLRIQARTSASAKVALLIMGRGPEPLRVTRRSSEFCRGLDFVDVTSGAGARHCCAGPGGPLRPGASIWTPTPRRLRAPRSDGPTFTTIRGRDDAPELPLPDADGIAANRAMVAIARNLPPVIRETPAAAAEVIPGDSTGIGRMRHSFAAGSHPAPMPGPCGFRGTRRTPGRVRGASKRSREDGLGTSVQPDRADSWTESVA
jgi:hypothetical protein